MAQSGELSRTNEETKSTIKHRLRSSDNLFSHRVNILFMSPIFGHIAAEIIPF